MAVQFNVAYTKGDKPAFYPEEIKVNPALNGRHEKPDIEWLISDILRHGQHTPVIIRKDGGDPVLVAGFSRWRAISEINKRKLGAVKMRIECSYARVNEVEGLLLNISENRFRKDVTPLDDAHNIKHLLNIYKMSEDEIAAIYFPTAKTDKELKEAAKFVKQRIGLISLAPESAAALKEGRLTDTAANAIAKLSQAQQKEVLKKKGTIERKDVVPKKIKVPGTDKELIRRVTLLLEDVDGLLNEVAKTGEKYVEVEVALLISVRDYLNSK